MDGVEVILAYAWNKDAVNLSAALNDVMTVKANDAIDNMTAAVAAQMFGQTVPESHDEQPHTEVEDLSDQSTEEPSDGIE